MLPKAIERSRLLLIFVLAIGYTSVAYSQQKSAPPKSLSPLAVADAQLKQNDLDSAEKILWSVLSTDPTNAEALTMLGVVRGRQQRFAAVCYNSTRSPSLWFAIWLARSLPKTNLRRR